MNKKAKDTIRKNRVSKKVKSVSIRPRLHVYRSNKHIYAQIIDISSGKILASASDAGKNQVKDQTKNQRAIEVGTNIAERAKKAKVLKVAFDRGSHKYHGRVKNLAEAARKAGLQF
jgi:large subunit ribosomal protein L18